jgi:hypothetical protein
MSKPIPVQSVLAITEPAKEYSQAVGIKLVGRGASVSSLHYPSLFAGASRLML